MSKICVNKLISDLDTGVQYLVLWLASDNAFGYWYEMSSNSRKPVKFDPGSIVSIENSLHYEISDYQSPDIRIESDISETERSHRDRLWAIMQSAVECEPEIYERTTRAEILHMVADEHNRPVLKP